MKSPLAPVTGVTSILRKSPADMLRFLMKARNHLTSSQKNVKKSSMSHYKLDLKTI